MKRRIAVVLLTLRPDNNGGVGSLPPNTQRQAKLNKKRTLSRVVRIEKMYEDDKVEMRTGPEDPS